MRSFFACSPQIEVERLVVVLDDGAQVGEAAVMVEAALLPREQTRERRRAVPLIGRSRGLEVVDADFLGGVHVPAGLGEERRDVTRRAARRAVEDRLAGSRARRASKLPGAGIGAGIDS